MGEYAIIVPARLGSQRFPRKLLAPVSGKPLILWTAENVKHIAGDVPLYFAVAEKELESVLQEAGYATILTDPDLPSGTDRIAVANESVDAEWVVNVQADEPVLTKPHLQALMGLLKPGVDMATLATPFRTVVDFNDPNKVKVVTGAKEQALYFSRAPIPYNRDAKAELPPAAYWHMGLYGYHASLLKRFRAWSPTPLEQLEKLEQLRILENGGQIAVGIVPERTIGVDVPGDLEELERYLS